jgi:hypothetical protein
MQGTNRSEALGSVCVGLEDRGSGLPCKRARQKLREIEREEEFDKPEECQASIVPRPLALGGAQADTADLLSVHRALVFYMGRILQLCVQVFAWST